MKLSKNFFNNFLFSEMPLFEASILAYEQKQKIFEMPKAIFNLYGVSFIFEADTKFEAFTTFNPIFTLIRRTLTLFGQGVFRDDPLSFFTITLRAFELTL